MKYFNEALQLDPNSVEAYAGIADLCNVALPWSRFLPPKQAEEKMRWVRQKLMVIDGRLAEGHAIQGFINLVFDWKPEEAEKELKQALELDPDLLVAHIWYGKYLLFTKKFREAERELKTAQQLDPIRYGLKVHVALPSFFEHRYDRAIELFERALEVAPGLNWAIWMVGRAHEEKGEYPSAIEAFQRAELAQGSKPDAVNQKYNALRDAYKKLGQDGYWRKKLDFVQREFEGWGASQALEVAAVVLIELKTVQHSIAGAVLVQREHRAARQGAIQFAVTSFNQRRDRSGARKLWNAKGLESGVAVLG